MPDFKQIPDSLLVPGMYQEIDNSLAGTREEIKKILIVSSSEKAADGKIERIASSIKAAEKYGYGSILSIMAENFLSINSRDELYCLSVKSSGIAFSEKYKIELLSSSESGSVNIKINATEITVSVDKGDSALTIAAKITASINSIFNLPLTAEVVDEVYINFSAITKGNQGITLSVESDNSKISITSIEKTQSSDSPVADWKPYFDAMGEVRYNYIINAFNDKNALKSFAEELESRYSALRQIGGRMFVYLSGEIGDASEEDSIIGRTLKINSPHIVVIPVLNSSTLPAIFLTRVAATAINSLIDDPSANTWGLEVSEIECDKNLSLDERQALLAGGVATYYKNAQGNVLIERLVTSYTTNADGERDTSYLDVQVVETVDAMRTYINTEAKRRFQGWKLSSTDETFGAGAKVMNAAVWKSFLCEIYKSVFMEERQWAQDFNSYKDSLSANVKTGTKTWLEYTHQPNLIGQFYIGSGLNQFK